MPASINIEIPKDAEPLDFLASFAPAFSECEGMRGSDFTTPSALIRRLAEGHRLRPIKAKT